MYRDDLAGECDEATHIVTALTVGAFEFFAGADAEGGAGATVAGTGAGVRGSSKRETLNQAGDEASCAQATAEDAAPPYGCGALLRLEVIPIAEGSGAPAPPVASVQPPVVDPAPVNPAAVNPTAVNPAAVDPAAGKPASVDPGTTLPVEPSPTAELSPAEPLSRPRVPPAKRPVYRPLAPIEEPPPPVPVDGGSITPYVIGGIVLAVLIAAGVAIGVAVANEKDDTTTTPPNGEPVNFAPVWRW